jgi:hypothetical protein
MNRMTVATVCLHISALIYAGITLVLLVWDPLGEPPGETPFWFRYGGFYLIPLAMAAGIERVVMGLRRGKTWGWVSAVCIFLVFIPSTFLPLAVVGLWALMSPAIRERFGVEALAHQRADPGANHPRSVIRRLIVLTLGLTAFMLVYMYFSGVGSPLSNSSQEALDAREVHKGIVIALGGVAAFSAILTAGVSIVLRRRDKP